MSQDAPDGLHLAETTPSHEGSDDVAVEILDGEVVITHKGVTVSHSASTWIGLALGHHNRSVDLDHIQDVVKYSRKYGARAAARRFEVSRRTVFRYRDTLKKHAERRREVRRAARLQSSEREPIPNRSKSETPNEQ